MELPLDFVERVKGETEGIDHQELLKSLDSSPVTSLRFNKNKTNGVQREHPIPWASHGMYLEKRPPFISDPLFHAGVYYVQEASSMVIEKVWEQTMSEVIAPAVLDLCAAPGGKSTLLIDMLPEEGSIICNEVIRARSSILRENIWRWSSPKAIVSNNDPKDFSKTDLLFDFIWVDAPCSGEGMFRKDLNARSEWSQSNVDLCAARQERIIEDIWDNLKEGGILGYSTCTFNSQENDDILNKILALGADLISLDLDTSYGFYQTPAGGYQAYPHLVKGEGFYFAVFRKQGAAIDAEPSKRREKKSKKTKVSNDLSSDSLEPWLKEHSFEWTQTRQVHELVSSSCKRLKERAKSLNIISSGIPVAEYNGKRFEIHPGLAFSSVVSTKSINRIDLNLKEAIDFLRKEDPGRRQPIGLTLFTFEGHGLGFGKVLPNRVNNNYPKNWRILKKWDHSEDWTLSPL